MALACSFIIALIVIWVPVSVCSVSGEFWSMLFEVTPPPNMALPQLF